MSEADPFPPARVARLRAVMEQLWNEYDGPVDIDALLGERNENGFPRWERRLLPDPADPRLVHYQLTPAGPRDGREPIPIGSVHLDDEQTPG